MHNQQGFESDNDSCNIDKKDKHPPLKRVWFIIFVVLIAIDTIMSGLFFYCSEQSLDIVDGRTIITALILINTIGVVIVGNITSYVKTKKLLLSVLKRNI